MNSPIPGNPRGTTFYYLITRGRKLLSKVETLSRVHPKLDPIVTKFVFYCIFTLQFSKACPRLRGHCLEFWKLKFVLWRNFRTLISQSYLDHLWGHEVGRAYPASIHTLATVFGFGGQLNGHAKTAQFDGGRVLFAESKMNLWVWVNLDIWAILGNFVHWGHFCAIKRMKDHTTYYLGFLSRNFFYLSCSRISTLKSKKSEQKYGQ